MYILFFFTVICFFLSHTQSASLEYKPVDIPNPNTHPEACGRPNVMKSAICDPDNVLSKGDKDAIEGYIMNIPQTLAQVGVLVIPKMHTGHVGYSTIESATESFARAVHDKWGVGDSVKNNGILLFLSIKDRSVFISTGKGVSGKLPYWALDTIIDHMAPYLKKTEYSKAFEHAIVEIGLILTDKKKAYSRKDPNDPEPSLFYVIAIFGGIFGIGYLLQMYKQNKLKNMKNGMASLDKLMKEMSDCKENDTFQSQSCPICLEDFPVSTPENPMDPSLKPTTSESKSPKRPMSLKCGHVFCYECLTQHLKSSSGTTCPICRAPVNPGDTTHPPSHPRYPSTQPRSDTDCSLNRNQNVNDATGASYTSAWMHRSPEFIYRLGRMNRMYPNVVTNELYASMSSAVNTGNIETIRLLSSQRNAEVNRIIADEAKRAAAQSRGSSGSSSSFGGGRSSGGRGGRF